MNNERLRIRTAIAKMSKVGGDAPVRICMARSSRPDPGRDEPSIPATFASREDLNFA